LILFGGGKTNFSPVTIGSEAPILIAPLVTSARRHYTCEHLILATCFARCLKLKLFTGHLLRHSRRFPASARKSDPAANGRIAFSPQFASASFLTCCGFLQLFREQTRKVLQYLLHYAWFGAIFASVQKQTQCKTPFQYIRIGGGN